MPLKDDLLRRGYFPENLPPAFSSEKIADYFRKKGDGRFLGNARTSVRGASFNASKRGLTRRSFTLPHPLTAHDTAEFLSQRWDAIFAFTSRNTISTSCPQHEPNERRAITITSHRDVEQIRYSKLAGYRLIAKTDISRFYHSVYTHSLPWAFHGKAAAKADQNANSAKVFFNRLDQILRNGQDKQTIGIPVGPDSSQVIAEVLSCAIDAIFKEKCEVEDYEVVRHVDDVWIGGNSYEDVEQALWRYREAIREFELDINENKTHIYSSNFSFVDDWPTDVSRRLDYATGTLEGPRQDRLRSALEHCFSIAVEKSDDGILKYVLSYLDDIGYGDIDWNTIEPFLKRVCIHFGHAVDYVVRVIVWRFLIYNDVDRESWKKILNTIIQIHGRLGNDSEVCWASYACIILDISLRKEIMLDAIENCGALSLVSLLHTKPEEPVDATVHERLLSKLEGESDEGQLWPLILEWKSKGWSGHKKIEIKLQTMKEMIEDKVFIFDPGRLPYNFSEKSPEDYRSITKAIDEDSSQYRTSIDEIRNLFSRREEDDTELPF